MCETLCKPESKNVICPVTQHSTAVTEHGVKCVRACLSPPLIFSFTSLKSSPPKAKVLDLQSSSYDTLFEAKNIWLQRLFNLLYTFWFLYFFFFFLLHGSKMATIWNLPTSSLLLFWKPSESVPWHWSIKQQFFHRLIYALLTDTVWSCYFILPK